MDCPNCHAIVELTWARYLKSFSGRHECPRCAATFRSRIPWRYWVLWFDILIAAILSELGLMHLIDTPYIYTWADALAPPLVIAIPTLFWGAVFLVLNRRALNRLESRAV